MNNTFALLGQVNEFKYEQSVIYDDVMLPWFLSLFQSIFFDILCQTSFICSYMKTSQYTTYVENHLFCACRATC